MGVLIRVCGGGNNNLKSAWDKCIEMAKSWTTAQKSSLELISIVKFMDGASASIEEKAAYAESQNENVTADLYKLSTDLFEEKHEELKSIAEIIMELQSRGDDDEDARKFWESRERMSRALGQLMKMVLLDMNFFVAQAANLHSGDAVCGEEAATEAAHPLELVDQCRCFRQGRLTQALLHRAFKGRSISVLSR